MGKYKGKRLKQDEGKVQSIMQHVAVFRHDEKQDTAEAAADTPIARSGAVSRPEEEPNAAETAAGAPIARSGAVSRPEEEPNAAETAADAPIARSGAVPRPEGEQNAAETAADAPAVRSSTALLIEEEPGAAEAVISTPVSEDTPASRPQKSRLFSIVLAIYMVVLLVVSFLLQFSLWGFLKDSQAEMDQQAAERAAQQAHEKALRQAPQLAFEAWQSGLTADYWTDLWYAKAPNDLDARGSVREFMSERFAPDAIEAFKAAGFTNAAPVYVLKNGEESLARITLAGSELDWNVSEVELLIEGTHSASVTVAESCHVYCNGKEMGGEYAEAAESRFNYDPLENRLTGAVTWVSYRVEGLLLEPELTVEPPEEYTVVQTEDGDYMLSPGWDVSAYTNKSVEFVKAYLYYYMRGLSNTRANLNKALAYLTPGTKAYQDLRDTYNGVYYAAVYTDIDTSKTFVEDVLVWADNCFSVDVVYNADCTSRGAHYDYADATMRIYFLQSGNGYIISNFETL